MSIGSSNSTIVNVQRKKDCTIIQNTKRGSHVCVFQQCRVLRNSYWVRIWWCRMVNELHINGLNFHNSAHLAIAVIKEYLDKGFIMFLLCFGGVASFAWANKFVEGFWYCNWVDTLFQDKITVAVLDSEVFGCVSYIPVVQLTWSCNHNDLSEHAISHACTLL